MTTIAQLVNDLKVDRDRLEKAIDVLSQLYGSPSPEAKQKLAKSWDGLLVRKPARRKMSPEAKARIAAAQRKRWAKWRKEAK